MRPAFRRAATAAVAAAAAGLFFLSRGKWSEAIIDSGREWIVPDALARGELLYRDVVYWFGPLTPYIQAAFFRAFGSSFSTLVLAGSVAAAAVLAALHFALRRVTVRSEAALVTALAVPVLVFMPNAGGPLLGMGYRIWHAATFALLAIALATARRRVGPGRAVLAGALCGLAGLCRTEWGAIGLVAILAALVVGRAPNRVRTGALAAGAWAVVFGGALGGFVLAAGARAVLHDGHVLLTGLPDETRTFLVRFSGVGNWRFGVLEMLYSAGFWLGLALAARAVALWREPGAPRRLVSMAVCVAALGALALAGGATGGAILYSGAPLVCAGAVAVGLSLRRGRRAAALVAFGVFGFLASGRRLFHIGDSGYVGPPMLFSLVCAAGLAQFLVLRQRRREPRRRVRVAFLWTTASLIGFAFLSRALDYADDKRVAVAGTQGMITARPELAARLSEVVRQLGTQAEAGGLVVFPEGEILNALTGRPNPIRHKLYIPGYLTDSNEAEVIAELERSPPPAIVIVYRPTSEYGPGLFGVDYGRALMKWIEERYALDAPDTRYRFVYNVGSWLRVGIRRPVAIMPVP